MMEIQQNIKGNWVELLLQMFGYFVDGLANLDVWKKLRCIICKLFISENFFFFPTYQEKPLVMLY